MADPTLDSVSKDSNDVAATTDDRPRQHKRTRAAMDPGTPKGEEGETSKGLTSSTPVAKKGRVQGDEEEGDEDGSEPSPPRSDDPAPQSEGTRATTPPNAANSTSGITPGTEGRETKHIRERVAAMKASSGGGEASSTDKEMKAADIAAEVSESAAKLGDQEEAKQNRDVEIAQVAAEVGKSSEIVNGGDDIPPPTEEMKTDEARVADEVSKVAAKVEKEDVEIAETAAETAKVAESVPETKPTTSKSTSFVPYTGTGSKGSTTSSSFSAFSSSSSPFASVSTPSEPSRPTTSAPSLDSQKPKTKTSFSASPFLASSIPPAKKPDSYTSSNNSSTSSSSSSTILAAPSTPASKPLSSNSPFSAFASTSGFASAAKPKLNAFGTPSGGGAKSAFSSYSAAPSAFASVPSTPVGKSNLPTTSTDEKSSTSASGEGEVEEKVSGDGGRKIGEPEQPDENKRIYTEQETHTGEEGDKVVHNVRAKLFAMQDGNWVERGMGPLKVNLTKRDGEKEGARIVMRADATHRLLLNSPLFKEFFIEVSNEKYVRFTIIEGSEPISYMARLGNPAAAEALVAAIRERTSAL